MADSNKAKDTTGTFTTDGVVIGSAGNDVMLPGYTDATGDKIDGLDAIVPGTFGNDDIIVGRAGNDLFDAGLGNDSLFGGSGNDTLVGGAGNDTLYGDTNLMVSGGFLVGGGTDDGGTHGTGGTSGGTHGTGGTSGGTNSGISGGVTFSYDASAIGNDVLYGGDGNDLAFGGNGNDLLFGGAGNDTLNGDAGNDTLNGNDGADSVTGGDGRDLVYGDAGNDIIDTSTGDASQRPDIGYRGLYTADSDVNNDKDTVFGGLGDDTIRTGDDADVIYGDADKSSIGGDDYIDAGVDNDTVYGGGGNDTIIGAEGNDSIEGGSGNDLIYGGYGPGTPDAVNIVDASDLAPNNGLDRIYGGDGNDTIFGMDDKDTLYGDAGNDVLDGGIDDDLLYGGDNADIAAGGQGNDTLYGDAGNDTVDGGTGNDVLYGGTGDDSLAGGDDRDLFVGGNGGDVVDGSEGGTDFDTLDLTGAGPLKIVYDPMNPENGTVQFLDPDNHHVTGTLTFKNIENVIPCFTPGTLIATPRGEVAVQSLRIGDRIITRDNGMQEIRWIGRRDLSAGDLVAAPHLRPVLIRQGSLGHGLPEVDLMVSPNHRLLVTNDRTALYFDEHEVLVAAKHLITSKGVQRVDAAGISYIHFMCDRHEVVLSNGAWSESFQPGDMTLKGMGNAQRAEIFDLFPALKSPVGVENYSAARKTLKRHEAALLRR